MPSVYESDRQRQQMAEQGRIDELRHSYCDETEFPNLPAMNSAAMWDFHAENSTTSKHPVTMRRIKATVELVETSGVVLDVGVGYGDIIPELLAKNPAVNYIGVDISEKMLRRLRSTYPDITFIDANLTPIERMADECADVILALEVLEHIPAPEILDFLAELRRLLKPNGSLIVSVPCGENLEWITYTCAHCGCLQNVNGHVRSYSPRLIEAELELAGFHASHIIATLLPGNYLLKAVIK